MLFKKKQNPNEIIEENIGHIANSPIQNTEVKFYSLLDIVKAERILAEVKTGNLIFLNIGKITPYPDRKRKFLESLKICSTESNAILKMVSDDTIMVAPPDIKIEIRSLSPLKTIRQNLESEIDLD